MINHFHSIIQMNLHSKLVHKKNWMRSTVQCDLSAMQAEMKGLLVKIIDERILICGIIKLKFDLSKYCHVLLQTKLKLNPSRIILSLKPYQINGLTNHAYTNQMEMYEKYPLKRKKKH